MRRVMFLFQGLEQGGVFLHFIEHCIMNLIEARQFVVVTTRPVTDSSSIILGMPELVTVMNLEKFGEEQKHWIAHVRLGTDGIAAYEKFSKQQQDRRRLNRGKRDRVNEN